MKRRDFIKCMGHTVAVPTVLGSFGFHSSSARALEALMKSSIEQGRVLILIYLNGGNDGLNTVVPMDAFDTLNSLRPDVILKEGALLRLSDTNLSFHPSLDGFRQLYQEKRLGIIQNVGYPEQNFSHFRSTDIWQSASDSNEVLNSGWLGRLLSDQHSEYPEAYPNENFPHPLAIEFGRSNSLLFQGTSSTMSMIINDPSAFYNLLDDVETPVPNSPAGDRLKFVRLIAKQSQQYGQVVKEAAEKAGTQVQYPDTGLADQMKIVAKLISGGLKTPIYKVSIKGFDTHSDQVESNDHSSGTHSQLLKELNDAVMSFMQDLESMGRANDVVGLTYSEFGRRVLSNGSLGTDHGAAAPVFVFGNKVQGGTIGSMPVIDPAMTVKDNLAAEFDFRQIYASVMQQWFEVDNTGISTAVAGDFETLPIIESGNLISPLSNAPYLSELSVFPNPVKEQATVRFTGKSGPAKVELFNLQGKRLKTLFETQIANGKIDISWNTTSLSSGKYLVILTQRNMRKVYPVVK